jgi:nucleotide-binding universal stress UspA family protein
VWNSPGNTRWRDFSVTFLDRPSAMNKILVPTDLSPTAETGLKLAVEIAKRCGATLSLVNFTKHPYYQTFSATGDITLKTDPQADLEAIEMLKVLKDRLDSYVAQYSSAEFPMEVAVVDNEFKQGIDEYLKAENIDLIVMGTSGEENAAEIFTGNHTEQAIRVSACPVLSVRDGFNIDQLSTMVIGVNIITDNRLADGLMTLKGLADCFDAHVHLVHVRDRSSDPTLILDEYFTKLGNIAGLKKFTVRILEADDPAEGLSHYAHEVGAGFLAIIKNTKEGIFRIFSNRLSNRLVKEEGGPVVTVNLQNR